MLGLRIFTRAIKTIGAAGCSRIQPLSFSSTDVIGLTRWHRPIGPRLNLPSLVQPCSLIHHMCSPLFLPRILNQKAISAEGVPIGHQTQVRTVTKFSRQKGKRKTVKAALKRFYRLDWGGWIRTRAGRHKHLWKKSGSLRRRLRQHVFCNSTQSWLLDKMVTKYWRKPKFYVDDPYEPYHTREEYFITRKKPV